MPSISVSPDRAGMAASGDTGRVVADGQSAPNSAAAEAVSADRQVGRQTRSITSPARRAKRRGPWGGASRCICAAHRLKMRPQNRESREGWERWVSDYRDGGLAGLPLDPPTPWLDGGYTRSGFRLPGPVGATRSPPASTRGITLSELLLRPCQAPAKRACP
jgi:hypothetical protein